MYLNVKRKVLIKKSSNTKGFVKFVLLFVDFDMKVLLLFFFIFFGNSCICAECSFTPLLDLFDSIPERFHSTNNLLKIEKHSLSFAKGKIVVIEGKVIDSNCVPLVDAFVGIWQLNSAWIDNNDVESDFFDSDTKTKIAGYDSVFAGNGSCVTDNLGRYSFVTVVPGTNSNYVLPRINFYIKHRDFAPFASAMYFEDLISLNNRGTIDIKDNLVDHLSQDLLKSLVAKKKSSEGSIDVYEFDICLAGSDFYRS